MTDMGLYNVVKPCVVGKLHYVRPTTQPIQVDDTEAAPLVESGSLTPYRPGGVQGGTGTILDGTIRTFPEAREAMESIDEPYTEGGQQAGEEFAEGVADASAEPESPATRPRRPRRSTED